MRLLILGSKGFIGSHCYSLFKNKKQFEVFGADVVADYNDPNYTIIDASNADFKMLFATNKFDYCINCSGASSVPDSFVNPSRDYLLNVHHVVLILNAIKELTPTCKFIQLSSAAVYGNPQVLPIKEEHQLTPISPYGLHKKQAEEICMMYNTHFNITTSVMRIFSAYGNGLKKQLFWDLYLKSKEGSEIQLFGTGNETRSFIHVIDIVNAIQAIVNHPNKGFQVYNVAALNSLSIADAAEVFLAKLGYNGSIKFNGAVRAGDPLYWQADIEKLVTLGYKQTISFDKGASNYAKWLSEKE